MFNSGVLLKLYMTVMCTHAVQVEEVSSFLQKISLNVHDKTRFWTLILKKTQKEQWISWKK